MQIYQKFKHNKQLQKQIIMILTIFSNTYCNTITHFTPLNEKQTQRQLLKI